MNLHWKVDYTLRKNINRNVLNIYSQRTLDPHANPQASLLNIKILAKVNNPFCRVAQHVFLTSYFVFLFRLLLELFWNWTIFCFFKFFLLARTLPWSGGSVWRLFSINSSCAWNWTVRRGSLLSTTSSPFLAALEFLDAEEREYRLIPGPYTDMLGCSMRRSSIGLASKTSGESPLASKQGGGVTYQLSSSWTWTFNFESSFSFSSEFLPFWTSTKIQSSSTLWVSSTDPGTSCSSVSPQM